MGLMRTIVAILMLCATAQAAEPLPCYVPAKVLSVHDGDTLHVDILLPWGMTLRNQTIRALDYDACEVSRVRHAEGINITDAELAQGAKCRDAFIKLLATGTLYVSPPQEGDRDPHGRTLARLTLMTKDGACVDVAQWMRRRRFCRGQQ